MVAEVGTTADAVRVGKAKANGFDGATPKAAVGGAAELTGTVGPAEGKVAAPEVTRDGKAETNGKDVDGEPNGKRNCSPDEGEAARDAANVKGTSGGIVERKLTAADGAVETGSIAAELGKGGLPPLTTEAKVGATPADMKVARGGAAAHCGQ